MLLGMTANANERKKPQGPATSLVVACAFAPAADALGYKEPLLPTNAQARVPVAQMPG
jgi:hypothetical protein